MPGFGFSTPVADGGWTMARVARTYDELMRRLGYASYGAHGSDGGAMSAASWPSSTPRASWARMSCSSSRSPPATRPSSRASAEGVRRPGFMGWFQSVGGYNAMNGTRPQTIAAALSDSPVGQLAYNELFENFGNGTSLVSPEQVLTQVSLYWLTNTSATAVRYHYAEQRPRARAGRQQGPDRRRGFKDDFQTIRPLAERDNATSRTGRSPSRWSLRRAGGPRAGRRTCGPSSVGRLFSPLRGRSALRSQGVPPPPCRDAVIFGSDDSRLGRREGDAVEERRASYDARRDGARRQHQGADGHALDPHHDHASSVEATEARVLVGM